MLLLENYFFFEFGLLVYQLLFLKLDLRFLWGDLRFQVCELIALKNRTKNGLLALVEAGYHLAEGLFLNVLFLVIVCSIYLLLLFEHSFHDFCTIVAFSSELLYEANN